MAWRSIRISRGRAPRSFASRSGGKSYPVIAAFDPKWSDKERLWFEKLFDAAAGRPAPETDDLRDMRDTYSYE